MSEGWLLSFLLLWVFVSLWVGHDAAENSPHSAVLWGLAVLVGGFLGLILYFILGRGDADPGTDVKGEHDTHHGLVECPNCHSLEEPERSVCRFCEQPIDGT